MSTVQQHRRHRGQQNRRDERDHGEPRRRHDPLEPLGDIGAGGTGLPLHPATRRLLEPRLPNPAPRRHRGGRQLPEDQQRRTRVAAPVEQRGTDRPETQQPNPAFVPFDNHVTLPKVCHRWMPGFTECPKPLTYSTQAFAAQALPEQASMARTGRLAVSTP
ncbi:hypothetical protein [Amycolatopsis lexingtonensis]|uniref:hypothetical protein n=1 Tax=Amycolatopsis lexingtonensis TaxID=218822 RepID=UPI003F6F114D